VASPCPAGINLTDAECARVRRNLRRSVQRYWSTSSAGAGLNGFTSQIGLMDIVYQAMTGDKVGGLADRRWQLRRYPVDLVNWPATNSDRRDVTLDRDFLQCCNQLVVSGGVLAADEALSAGSSDFLTEGSGMSVDSGGSGGSQWIGPNPWLLVYYMGKVAAADEQTDGRP
jgi:hypothetical protein